MAERERETVVTNAAKELIGCLLIDDGGECDASGSASASASAGEEQERVKLQQKAQRIIR